MTIQEAITSGKPFKRPYHLAWYCVHKSGYVMDIENMHNWMYLMRDDVFADDWKVLEEKKCGGCKCGKEE